MKSELKRGFCRQNQQPGWPEAQFSRDEQRLPRAGLHYSTGSAQQTLRLVTSKESRAAPVSQFDGLAGRRFSKAKSIADRLGVCPRTVFRWADAGKIARYKINQRVVIFDEAEVAAFIESARVGCERRNEVVVVKPAKRRKADRQQGT